MRGLLLASLLLVLIGIGNAQDETRLSLYANTLNAQNFHSYSLNPTIDIAVSDHFNIRYSLGFGIRGNKKFYMHSPVSAPVGMVLFVAGLGSSGSFLSTLGILLLIAPEGVSYDIRLSDKVELSPFIDLNSCEYFLSGDSNTLNFLISGDAGLSSQLYISEKFYLSAHASAMLLETKGLGFSAGAGMGIAF